MIINHACLSDNDVFKKLRKAEIISGPWQCPQCEQDWQVSVMYMGPLEGFSAKRVNK